MIQAVIFDMDGLMVDSEPLHYKAFSEVLDDLGITYTISDNSRYLGLSDADESRDLIRRYKLSLSVDELVKRKGKAYKNLLPQVETQPCLEILLEKLHKEGFKKAVASSSSLEEIEKIIKSHKIEQYFDGIFSAELVEHGKPSPDLFLLTAEKMNMLPQNCLVLEDAKNGVLAAHAAGMKIIAVTNEYTKDHDFSKADMVVNSLKSVTIDMLNSL